MSPMKHCPLHRGALIHSMIQGESEGRESTTEQSLGENVAELVGWAYRGAHETTNQWKGFT